MRLSSNLRRRRSSRIENKLTSPLGVDRFEIDSKAHRLRFAPPWGASVPGWIYQVSHFILSPYAHVAIEKRTRGAAAPRSGNAREIPLEWIGRTSGSQAVCARIWHSGFCSGRHRPRSHEHRAGAGADPGEVKRVRLYPFYFPFFWSCFPCRFVHRHSPLDEVLTTPVAPVGPVGPVGPVAAVQVPAPFSD